MVSMATETDLGRGSVTIGGQQQHWDRLTLLASGILRVARTTTWKAAGGVRCTAEHAVEYHAPGTWGSLVPEVTTNGTLLVHCEGYDPDVLATSITEPQAIDTAARYLLNNYTDADWAADRVTNYFGSYSSGVRLARAQSSREETVRFTFELPPPH